MQPELGLEGDVEPQFDTDGTKATRGYFRVDHQIFQDEAIRRLSGDCFRIYLWMSSRAWRFPSSRGFLRASVSMIRLNTGVSEATVSRALKDLKEAGLIRLVRADYKMGNQWWVKAIFNSLQNESTQSEVPRFERAVASKRDRSSIKMVGEHSQSEGDIRSIKETDKEEKEMAAHKKALTVFKKTYPDTDLRCAVLNDLIAREFVGAFKPPRQVMENLVVRKWFEGISDNKV